MNIKDIEVIISLDNSEKYLIPAIVVAENRSKFKGINIQESIDLFESDIFEMYDWIRAMYWAEISTHATQIYTKQYDYDELLTTSHLELR